MSSLKLLLGRTMDLDELLLNIVVNLKSLLAEKGKLDKEELFKRYETALFRKDKPSTFKNQNDEMFMGFIKGVSSAGKLKILMEDDIMKEFSLKEVQLLY